MLRFSIHLALGFAALLAAQPVAAGQPAAPPPTRQPGPAAGGGQGEGRPGAADGQPTRRGQGLPPRDQTAEPKGTARIRGVVVAADAGTPIRRATVRASAREFRETRTALTDSAGRYEFKDLPAGRYSVEVSKAGFVTMSFGQRYAFEAGRPVDVPDASLLDTINFSLPRGGVITGRIMDEFGDAVADAMVSASRYQFQRGRTRLTPVSRFSQTNDLGQFRMYGLAPGDYIVTATLRSREALGAETQDATGYAPTYYPGTSSPSEAQRVRVALGLEAAADFALISARLVRVSGLVVSSTGRPATGGVIRLQDREAGAGFRGGKNARIDQDGSFTLTGVAPGDYVLTAGLGGFRPGPDGAEDAELVRLPVNVGSEDVKGLLLTTSKGAVASGRVVFESGQAAATAGAMRVVVAPTDPDEQVGPGGNRGGRVNDNWTFELRDLFGRSVVGVTGLPGASWFAKSVTLAGDDLTDAGFEPKGGQRITGLQITLSDRAATLTGAVTDGKGRAVTDYSVVVFSADESKWVHPFNRYTSAGRPDQSGRYTIARLPPGEYLAVAVDYLDASAGLDPDLLSRLRDAATTVTLGDAETKTVNLGLTP